MPAIRCLCASLLLVLIGCTSTKTSNTARTGTEQLLISNAVDQALGKVDFSQLAGKRVLVEEKYLDSIDKGYIISSIRHHVVHAGGQLTAKPEEADIILELRSGGVGTDTSDAFLGVPGISLPGMITLPDLKLVTRTRQSAFAKLGIVAIDAKSQHEMGAGGVSLAMSDDNNWYVMGVGPYRQGTMDREVKTSLNTGWSAMDSTLPTTITFNKPGATNRRISPRPAINQPETHEVAGRIQLTADEAPATKEPQKSAATSIPTAPDETEAAKSAFEE